MEPSAGMQRYRRQTKDEESISFYGNTLTYECGLARRFLDSESDLLYDKRSMTCNWNKTWTPSPELDSCEWVACIHPPEAPPFANLVVEWDGLPVNFTHNVSYSCSSDDVPTYFELDKKMLDYNVTCLGIIACTIIKYIALIFR